MELSCLNKRRKVLKTAAPIRMQTFANSTTIKKGKQKSKLKGRLLAVQQAIGGLSCRDCGTSWSKQWVNMLLDGEDDPAPLCTWCHHFRQRHGRQKRPAAAVRKLERRRMHSLLYSQHSSWGSLDLMKADPRLISGQHPLSLAPFHLTCTPLPLELAVCLSRYKQKKCKEKKDKLHIAGVRYIFYMTI